MEVIYAKHAETILKAIRTKWYHMHVYKTKNDHRFLKETEMTQAKTYDIFKVSRDNLTIT